MRFLLFPFLYLSVFMAVWQSIGWAAGGWIFGLVVTGVLMLFVHMLFGVLGGRQ